jgi:hypothetical protein
MATSQNGWPVYTSGTHSDLVAIPKIVGRVRKGDVATVFTYLVDRFDREVEDVDEGRDEWGYAYRAIRGKTSGYSNHASATALDLNAMQHPLGWVNTFTSTQRAALRRILNDLEGVVRWGGDYSGRKDEMHFEINASAKAVARVASKIRGGSLVSNPITGGGAVTVPNIPGAPAPITPEDDMAQVPQDQWANLYALVQNIAGWVYLGGKGVNAGDAAGGTIAQRSINLDRQLTGAQGNSTNVVDAVGVLLARTADVARKDGPVSIRQEIADSKTFSAEAVALLAGQAELIRQLVAGGGSAVQVDYDRIEASMRAAVAEGASEVIDAIEDGIDVGITVTTPTTKKG